MKASEFRIGNFCLDEFGLLVEVDIDFFVNYVQDKFKPIPLTEEWLLRFGFEKGNKIYPTGYSIELLKTDFYLRPSYLGGYYWGFNKDEDNIDCELNDVQPIQHVHQLQNLYFALTNTELLCKH